METKLSHSEFTKLSSDEQDAFIKNYHKSRAQIKVMSPGQRTIHFQDTNMMNNVLRRRDPLYRKTNVVKLANNKKNRNWDQVHHL